MNAEIAKWIFSQPSQDTYAILQLKDDPATRDLRFESLDRVKRAGHTVSYDNYDFVYAGEIMAKKPLDAGAYLEELYGVFNYEHPGDFTGHSLSVSDVVLLKHGDEISAYYTDRFSFSRLPDFFPEREGFSIDPNMCNLEIQLEDDYGMIDGIINNGSRKEEPKQSISDQIRAVHQESTSPGHEKRTRHEPSR